jgi:hypothetical protein
MAICRFYRPRHLGSCFEITRNSSATYPCRTATVVVLFRVTGRGGAIPLLLRHATATLQGHVLFSENGSLKGLLTIEFTRHRVLVPTSWLSLGKADMTAPPLFSGYVQIN